MISCEIRNTPIGEIIITADNEAVLSLMMKKDYVPSDKIVMQSTKLIDDAFRELEEYLEGRRKEFTVPVKLQGTDFQVKVWQTLKQIPFGQTVSYGKLAEMSGYPGAARAVGGAMRENRIPVFIPCHRVITSDGKLGGYSCGLDMKKKLLQLEGVSLLACQADL